MSKQVDWTFDGTWPYQPHYFDSGVGRMHYVDEGPRDGKPVVMVHGNPTWGCLYRNFIGPLTKAGYRAIAVDHLGMGRSEKPNKAELYRVPRHVDRLVSLLDSLELRDATVVVQDWGGPIGLAWAARRPEHVQRLYIMNTFAHHPPDNAAVPNILKFIRAPLVGEVLIKGAHAFVKQLLFKAIRKDRLNETSRAAYLAPHPTFGSRTP